MNIFYFICFFSFLLNVQSLCGEEEKFLCHKYFPSHTLTLAVDPYVPQDYEVFSAHPETESDIAWGVFWGREKDVEAIWKFLLDRNLRKTAFPKLESGVFYLFISKDILQLGKNTFTGESELCDNFRKMGHKDVQSRKMAWGDYPVLVVDGFSVDEIPSPIAWVGLNSHNHVLCISYYHSDNIEEGEKIWNDFLNQTKMFPRDQFLRANGYDIREGATVMTLSNCKIETLSERKTASGEMRLLLSPLTEKTTFTVDKVERCYTEFSEEECLKVHLTVDSGANGYNVITRTVVTVNPKHVDDFSLAGKEIKRFENVVLMESSYHSQR